MARWLRRLFWIVSIMVLVAVIGVGLYVYYVPLPAQDLPHPTRFLDQEGNEIPTLYGQNRIIISPEDMPIYLREAFVAIEDYRFYRHFGLDPVGIARAFWKNLRAGRIVEGGSTITQQLAKNLFLTPERTLARKIPEILLTLQLEVKFSKEDILTMYMNQIYFGHGAYGVETASQTFFGKTARELTLGESALLAGVPRAPARYSPLLDWEASISRQHLILDRMVDLGYISQQQAAAAKAEEIVLVEQSPPVTRTQYFIDYVVRELEKEHPQIARRLEAGGVTVQTTLNRKLQQAAEQALLAGLPEGSPDENGITQPQGALVAMDPTTGHILALVGGKNYQQTQFNRATALRQPGSAFKPFVYLAALENGYTLANSIMCQEVEFTVPGTQDTYRPTDYGDEPYHNRPLTLREALVISDNVVSSILNYELGPERGIEYARRLGIESPLKPYLSSALGTSEVTPLELVRAFCALANGGRRVETIAVTKITDARGRTMLENRPRLRQEVNPAAAYIITDVLKEVLEPGGTAANIGWMVNRPAAGKTGTSQDYGNAWFIGYTPDLVAGVWVGKDKSSESAGGSGASLAAPIWADFIQRGLAGTPKPDFPRPQNVTEVDICTESGLRAGWWCPRENITTELFIRGTEPWQYCDIHSALDWNWLDRFLPPPQWDQPRNMPESLPENQQEDVNLPGTSPPPRRPQTGPQVNQGVPKPAPGEQGQPAPEGAEAGDTPPDGGNGNSGAGNAETAGPGSLPAAEENTGAGETEETAAPEGTAAERAPETPNGAGEGEEEEGLENMPPKPQMEDVEDGEGSEPPPDPPEAEGQEGDGPLQGAAIPLALAAAITILLAGP